MGLLQADAAPTRWIYKISRSALMNPSLEGLLAEMGMNRVWIELPALLLNGDARPVLERSKHICPVNLILSD